MAPWTWVAEIMMRNACADIAMVMIIACCWFELRTLTYTYVFSKNIVCRYRYALLFEATLQSQNELERRCS